MLLVAVCGCVAPRHPNQNEKTSSPNFKIRYNALYNVDKLLLQVENNFRYSTSSLFGTPNKSYFANMDGVVTRLQELLPLTNHSYLQEELYFKLGKAYFFKAEYYNALAYLDLITDKSLSLDATLWKAKALYSLSKTNESLRIINDFPKDELSKKDKALFYALKADNFLVAYQPDSAATYLQQAVKTFLPKKYKQHWQLQLGKLYANKGNALASNYLRKVAKSNTVSDEIKLEAEIALANIKSNKLEQRTDALLRILNKGYSIGKEQKVFAAIADNFALASNLDTAVNYYQKSLQYQTESASFRNLVHWKLAKIYLQQNQIELAGNSLAEITLDSLDLVGQNYAVLIENYQEWLDLLISTKKLEKENANAESYEQALYELASFYRKYNLKDEALSLMKKLVEISAYQNMDYLQELALLDSDTIEFANQAYEQKLLKQRKFYTNYAQLYAAYESDKYSDVIRKVDSLLDEDSWEISHKSKFSYLQAFALGHIHPVDSLIEALENVRQNYIHTPEGKRADHHLGFIANNKSDFAKRKVALEKSREIFQMKELELNVDTLASNSQMRDPQNIGTFIEYELPKLEPYYFVVMVENPRVNLAPSRYAIGHFLRTRYANSGYGHSLSFLGDTVQMISVGVFESLDVAKGFESNIVGFLPEIIKVGEKKYTTFVIPKSIFELSKDKSQIDEYLDKYINK
jgi:tetratricopeptide (TPR) repeat protein